MLLLSMIILSGLMFYAKIMMHYEKQNAFESIYAMNVINIILFAIVLKCRGKHIRKRFQNTRLSQGEEEAIRNEYNVFSINKEDRMTFVYISINLLLGVSFFYHALSWVDIRQYTLVTLVVLGGLIPTVMNLKVQIWMKNECKIPNFVQQASNKEMWIYAFNLITAVIGFLLIIYQFGKDLDKPDVEGEGYPNFYAFISAALAGLFIGYAFGQVRILCGYKEVRQKLYQ